MAKGGYVYIVGNKYRTVFYTGVTANLSARSWEHKHKTGSIFTSMYNCTDLLYYQFFETIEEAIEQEKKIKKWRKNWKIELIRKLNPTFKDLFDEVAEMD